MEKDRQQELKALIDGGLFVRAERLARELELHDQSQDLQRKALWQMAAVNRNMPGTKKLAEMYNLSKAEVITTLREILNSQKGDRENRTLEPCYDQYTGQYLPFEEWLNQLSKRWEKIGKD